MTPLLAALALAAAAPSPPPTPNTPPVAVHPGDTITEAQLFGYLSYPAAPGDWVRYRVIFADRTAVDKTIGFGSETVAGKPTLFIETRVSASAVTGLPAETTSGIGTDAVLKTYVVADAFGDLASAYPVVTNALKVGDLEYEVSAAAGQTYSVLTGGENAPAHAGTIASIAALDVRVGDKTLHVTRVVADFRGSALPLGGMTTPLTLEVWQSPDVPLGTVAIEAGGGHQVDWRLIAFGHGYRSAFSKTLDALRAVTHPSSP